MSTQEIMRKLQEPFPPTEIEWRTQSCGITNTRPWAKVLGYIQARAIQRRFDDVFGWDGWTEEYRVSNTDIICRLGVKTSEGWIYKENGASNTDIEAFKGGISGAFKRVAASGYGVGRYLYNLEESFAECQLQKPSNMSGWNKARTKDKQDLYWKEPELPSWALPEGYTKPKSAGQGNPPPTKPQQNTGQNNQSTGQNSTDGPSDKEFGEMVDGMTQKTCTDPTCKTPKTQLAPEVIEYSLKKFGKVLCRYCQGKHKSA